MGSNQNKISYQIQYVESEFGVKIKLIPDLNDNDYIRFWSKASLTANPEKCWEWNGWVLKGAKPYGQFTINGTVFQSHRVAYFLHYKKDPSTLHVLHKCDNHKCVNPNHLFLGTNNDNIQDKIKKGRYRSNKGKKWTTEYGNWKNCRSKLTESQYHEIINLYSTGDVSLRHLATLYNVSRPVIAKVVKRMGGNIFKRSKLNETDVVEIRSKFKNDMVAAKDLAVEYDVTNKTIMDIVHNRNWKHIQ
jgi:predicted DNA-binding protein YlxM (UPF0122 family)